MKNLTKKLISGVLPVVAVSALGFAGSAQATTLTGTTGGSFTLTGDFSLTAINPDHTKLFTGGTPPLDPSATGGVILNFDPQTAPNGGATFGGPGSTTGEFIPWASDTTSLPSVDTLAEILDIGILPGGNLVLPTDTSTVLSSIPNLLLADQSATAPGVPILNVGWSFELEEVDSQPVFIPIGNDVIVGVGFSGKFYDENGLHVLNGSGNFTSQFEDETVLGLLASLIGWVNPGADGIPGNADDTLAAPITRFNTWSADFRATPITVPESDAKVGLVIALGLGLVSIKKGKKILG
jgi:hypothetical protein